MRSATMELQTFRNPLKEDNLDVEKLLVLGPVQPRNIDRNGTTVLVSGKLVSAISRQLV